MMRRVVSKLFKLLDVNFTPGAGVDDYALLYDHGTTKFVGGSVLKADGSITGATSQDQVFTNNVSAAAYEIGDTLILHDTGSGNLFLGPDSGLDQTGSSGVAIGNAAGRDNTANSMVAVGASALRSNTGISCIGIGINAGQDNTVASCIAIGGSALRSNSGSSCVAVGISALRNNTATACIGIGSSAMYDNTGTNSIGIGFEALRLNSANNNVAVGYRALRANTGAGSVGIGYRAGYGNTGAKNIFIGNQAGDGQTVPANTFWVEHTNGATPFLYGEMANHNLGLNIKDFGDGNGVLAIADGTAPTTAITNGSAIYSSSGELYAYDAAGNTTQLSPHDPDTGEWVFHSTNTKTGRTVRIEMEQLVQAVEQMSGRKFMEVTE